MLLLERMVGVILACIRDGAMTYCSILPALQQESDWSLSNAAQVTKQLPQNRSHIASTAVSATLTQLIGNQATGCNECVIRHHIEQCGTP